MKAIQTKPMLYAYFLNLMQEKAREMGYNLVIHGSMQRDCDLVAIPWTDDPQPHFELIRALDFIITRRTDYTDPKNYLYSVLPGGRHSYVINVLRNHYLPPDYEVYVEDPQFYLDISVTPFYRPLLGMSEERAQQWAQHLNAVEELTAGHSAGITTGRLPDRDPDPFTLI